MPAPQFDVESSSGLLERLSQARARTDELFGIVQNESLYERPIPERHRIVFYIGHLEAFDWNLLRERLFPLRAFNPGLDRLFAFGIDPVGGGLPTDQPSDWPVLTQVREYVGRVRESVDTALAGLRSADWDRIQGGDDFSANILLNVAVEHRLMHAETLTYMFHQLPVEQKIPQARRIRLTFAPLKAGMIEIPPGMATLGLSRSDRRCFGWDNEYEEHSIEVAGFAIDKYKITNGQYLDFVAAGGYENPACWEEADWNWKTAEQVEHPVFWQRDGDRWALRTMFDEVPLPLDWPVYVSQAEAKAFARWAGKSLPTETQWHRAAYADANWERPYPWGGEPPSDKFGNFDFANWDPTPVNAFPAANSALGVADMLGNGWEWTSTPFGPFADFKPFSFYPGYSANFFDGKHLVMKGGSARTAACMLRRSFRNWFQPHYQYVYAGFRCVSN